MTNHHSYRGLVWLDVESPTEEEIGSLVKRYSLHPLVGEELRSESPHGRMIAYPEHILVVVRVPSRVRKDDAFEIVDREIDFVIGRNFLITCRYDTIEQME